MHYNLMELPIIDLQKELSKLKSEGWIKSHRVSDTGVGKTIEDMLGIPENNVGKPDCIYNGREVEIKAHRVNSKSMITLFTLEAGIRRLRDVELMKKYGYIDKTGRRALKITLTTQGFTAQGLKLKVEPEKGEISIVDYSGSQLWIWNISDIKLKLNNLCIIYVKSKKEGENEYFRIDNAILLTGLDENQFFKLVDKGILKIDLRMHLKQSGASRNHGTGFRILSFQNLSECYSNTIQLV